MPFYSLPEDDALPEEEPTGVSKVPASETQRWLTLLKHVFRQFAGSRDLDTDQFAEVTMEEFVGYATDFFTMHNMQEQQEIIEGLQIQKKDWVAVEENLQNPYQACSLLLPLWPALIRPQVSRHVLDFFHITITIGFKDQKSLQIQMPQPWAPGAPCTTGFICALMRDKCHRAIHAIGVNGLDALYEEFAAFPGDDSPSQPFPLDDAPAPGKHGDC